MRIQRLTLLLSLLTCLVHAATAQDETVKTVVRAINPSSGEVTLYIGLEKTDGVTRLRELFNRPIELEILDAPGAVTEISNGKLEFLWIEGKRLPRYVRYKLPIADIQKLVIQGDYSFQSHNRVYQDIIVNQSVNTSSKQIQPDYTQFSGSVSLDGSAELENVRVENLNGPFVTRTDEKGQFSIRACPGDTLHFKKEGTHSCIRVVSQEDHNKLLQVSMKNYWSMSPVPVECKMNARGEYRLFRNGIEYYVNGGGGSEQWEELARIGGNSVRTWSTDNAKEVLDKAHALGLTVMMGLWMQHERHGFDYDDKPKVQAQLDYFRKIVMEIKDHPALLLWGIGNEVDLFYTNTNVWKAVNDVAKMIHELDPHHPTSTVTAGLDPAEVKLIMQDAPEIDIYCINTYGDIGSVKKNLANYGWKGPYMITEWGPNGHWEVTKTRWGAPIEQTSAEKADSYKERYENEILAASKNCMGSYVFLWGFKQETTSTWYGLFTREGLRSEPIDELEQFWNGRPPLNNAPHLISLSIDNKIAAQSIMLTADKKYETLVSVIDPNGDKLTGKWQIVPESTDIKAGGDAETAPMPINGLFKSKSATGATFRAPGAEGAYRLFYEVTDGNGHCAYGNIPFYVVPPGAGDESARFVKFKQLEMQ